MSWKNSIPGCFGTQDIEFGSGALDRDRARKLLVNLLEQKVSFADIEVAFAEHLRNKKVTDDHLEKQLKKIGLLKNWCE